MENGIKFENANAVADYMETHVGFVDWTTNTVYPIKNKERIEYVTTTDGEEVWKVNFDTKVAELIWEEGRPYPRVTGMTYDGHVESYIHDEGYDPQSFAIIYGDSRDKETKAISHHDQPMRENDERLDYEDGDDGQPDEQKEWEDFEGPELPVEEY